MTAISRANSANKTYAQASFIFCKIEREPPEWSRTMAVCNSALGESLRFALPLVIPHGTPFAFREADAGALSRRCKDHLVFSG
jgi:hypothetical protein